jgi:hypothetical protein
MSRNIVLVPAPKRGLNPILWRLFGIVTLTLALAPKVALDHAGSLTLGNQLKRLAGN